MRIGKVFACQPGYKMNGVRDSHRAFDVGSSLGKLYGGKLIALIGGCSLLAHNFNKFWVTALNMAAQGEDITHFAMLHDDVVPQNGWLDILLDDMDATGADVMSAVIPIKDHFGTTSTGIDDPVDPFLIERRLTMHEIMSLPMVFGAKDCGYPDRKLLVNTGCFVCKFDPKWRTKITFTIKDRNVFNTNSGLWEARVAPEDWNFSRDIQDYGGVVRASRNVRLVHEQPYFNNYEVWGQYTYDQMFGHKFGFKTIQERLAEQQAAIPVNGVCDSIGTAVLSGAI